MNPSIGSALNRAIAHTRWMLFEPFSFWKWFRLALVAVFVNGIGFNNLNPPGQVWAEAWKWYQADPEAAKALFIKLGMAAGVLALLFTYLTARFEPVFVDNVCSNHGNLREPWKRLARVGLAWVPVRLAVRVLGVGTLVLLAIPTVRAILAAGGARMTSFPVEILLWVIPGLIAWVVGTMLLTIILDDVGLPLAMYGGKGVFGGIREAFRLVFSRPVYFLLFGLVKIAAGMVGGMLMSMAGCVVMGVFLIVGGIIGVAVVALVKGTGMSPTSPAMLAVLIPLGAAGFLMYAITINLVATPINVFFRAFGLAAVEEFGEVKTLSRAYAAREAA